MAISPLLSSGMIQRTDDVGMLKLQQDNRPLVEQQSAQGQMVKKADEFSHQVVTPADSNKADTHADAREEGKNKFFSQKKSEKKQIKKQEDKVVKKYTSGGFDMKV